jgi:hypothetical protein
MTQQPKKIPRLPRLYCGRILNHRGYLVEVKRLKGNQALVRCQACGWEGVVPVGPS